MQAPGSRPATPGPPEDRVSGQSGVPIPADEDKEARRRQAKAAARYEDFLRSSVDWLWETDPSLTLTYVSSPIALNLGIPAQVLIGRPFLGLGRFETGGGADRQGQAAIETRRPFRNALFVMTGAEGREVSYGLSGVPYFDDADGGFAGYRGTAVIWPAEPVPEAPATEDDRQTLARTLEETLLLYQDASWRLAQAKDGSAQPAPRLDRLAHELRTPLNAVIGYSDLALKEVFGPLGERYADCFRTIREAGRHLDQLVSYLQERAKETASAALVTETVEVPTVVAKAKAIVALAAQEAGVDVSRVGPMAGGRVVGDRLACTQILVNLLQNAIKFTPSGGSVGLETVAGPDDKLRIVVWDTGVGIPEGEQQRIFETDYRAVEAQDLGQVSGQGLGLSIARSLARSMGGDLTVSSQPGHGSRFTLSLPLSGAPVVGLP